MNPATFRILSEAVGLTAEMYSRALGVNLRSAERWFGKVPPPPDAVDYLTKAQSAVFSLVQQLETRAQIPFYTREHSYLHATGATLPYSMYCAAVHLAAASLARQGKPVDVRFLSKENLDITITERSDAPDPKN